MKLFVMLIAILLATTSLQAQLLKKIKQKTEDAIEKKISKSAESKTEENKEDNTDKTEPVTAVSKSDNTAGLKVYSKFDFVPGSTILYYDNFEKDNTGETPLGWITNTSAEVVDIEGLEGKWLKLNATNSRHFIRSKKQSWGNNFTIEFDMLIVKNTYDPRLNISLVSTGGNLVTDESILLKNKPVVSFESIIAGSGSSRISLSGIEGKKFSDNMTGSLTYSNTTPVHVSMCVQGKRFRMWWNEQKLYDLSAINEEYLPNQLGFAFGNVGGSDFFINNIRIAKDVPDTRARFEEGKLVSNLLFYSGTANLKPESLGSLLDLSKVLKEAASPVKIVGHTDSDGDDASNQDLSLQRAKAIKEILVSRFNIAENQLTVEGRGETQPIADNNTVEGKAQNRRVEFIFKSAADVYVKPAGIAGSTSSAAPGKTVAGKATASPATTTVSLQSKILTIQLPYAQISRAGENRYTFIASKEEGNSKENYFKINMETVNTSLKAESYNFKEINEKNALYGTKKFSEIISNEAVLYYGAAKQPYIYKFSPIIANGSMASYVSESLARNLPAPSPKCKLVIEKVENGMVSGYFIAGIMIQGLKPVKKGDAMQETFTEGFSGEVKCTFSNVPVY